MCRVLNEVLGATVVWVGNDARLHIGGMWENDLMKGETHRRRVGESKVEKERDRLGQPDHPFLK